MDQETRNKLQRATQQIRRLLEAEFAEQLEGTFDILPSGKVLPTPGKHLDARQRLTRQKLADAIEHIKAGGKKPQEAVEEYTREAAFTFLNRFVALRMLEARDLLQECVSKGDQSSGFREFCGLAPGLVSLPDGGYRLYLECLFDELSVEVKVLFDRRDSASLLWPRRTALNELLDILGQADLAHIWGEDETLGWVYQYFNSGEERSKMRDESTAPRNSRELAVRNQFFTPRYVVEFLTDNTLGRIWYEMRKGETRLVDECRYLVRRAGEVFLREGQEQPAAEGDAEQDLSAEESLKKTVYTPHRAKKDPRDLKILDPACGSGHFLLYAFDLFLTIYEEAWQDEQSPDSQVSGRPLRADYSQMDALRAAIPGLVLRHNLHGIDIDPRAAQIAALALWMRGQRAFNEFQITREQRAAIARSNIVCAEPMPGEAAFLNEFINEHLSNDAEGRFLASLVRKVFEAMKLAGEAGSLLKIDEDIAVEVAKAKKQWLERPEYTQQMLIVDGPTTVQMELDLTHGITDESFWETAEHHIYNALRAYSETAERSGGFQRRLFAADAARGFSFIDVSRQQFDSIVMNPPFGDASEILGTALKRLYPAWGNNLACAFVIRAREMTFRNGFTGAILDNATAVRSTYEDFRRSEYLSRGVATLIAPFGWGVLDAYVETYAVVRAVNDECTLGILGCDLKSVPLDEKGVALQSAFTDQRSERLAHLSIATIDKLPNAVLDLSWPEFLVESFARHASLEEAGLSSYQGHALEAARHYRMYWELPLGTDLSGNGDWVMAFKGGEYSPGYLHDSWVALIGDGYRLVPHKSSNVLRNKDLHFLGGVGYGKRGEFVDAQPLRSSSMFTHEGMAFVIADESERWFLLALVNSDFFNFGINKYCGQHKQSGYVNLFPCPNSRQMEAEGIRAATLRFVALKAKWFQRHEADYLFRGSPLLEQCIDGPLADRIVKLEEEFRRDQSDLQNAWDTINVAISRVFNLDDEQAAEIAKYCGSRPALELCYHSGSCSSGLRASVFLAEAVSYLMGRLFGRFAKTFEPSVDFANVFDSLPSRRPSEPSQLGDGREVLVTDRGSKDDVGEALRALVDEECSFTFEELNSELSKHNGEESVESFLRRAEGFFSFHLNQHSVGNRKSPIYWQLATPSSSYSVWLYYHRIARDTFFQVLNEHVKPKMNHERQKLERMRSEAGTEPTRSQGKEIEEQEKFVAELSSMVEEVERIAPLWNPELNDGVIINFAPIWRLVPQNKAWQKECKSCWDTLVKGDYDWAHLAMHLWPERVVPRCVTDASLAIAHGLEDTFWQSDERDRLQPKEEPEGGWQPVIDRLVKERTSPAVQAALQSLLDAPTPSASTARSRRRTSARA